jgi:MGT family glycosyltransferase
MSRFLVVTWDGAGNLTPALSVAKVLTTRGHDVRLLGHRAIHERCGDHGWRFRPFTHTAELDSSVAFATEDEELDFVVHELMMSSAVARDVADEIEREPVDGLVVDSMLLAALSAGEAAVVSTVALFSTAFSIFRGGPFVQAISPAIASLNRLRSELKLPEVAGPSDVHDRCALNLVASLMEFEPTVSFPPNVRFVGPLVDGPPLMRGDPVDVQRSSSPLVVVSFCTLAQRQHDPLQRVVDALGLLPVQVLVTTGAAVSPDSISAPSNTQVVRFVPHEQVVPDASLVVTHAGLGTIMKAFAYGVPLVCMPMGRDQFFNAAQVEALGAGMTIAVETDATAIAEVVRRALEDQTLRSNTRHLAGLVATYGGEADAVAEIESVCRC